MRAAGHASYPMTLSGLAEKQGVPAGQQTHVQDIVDEVLRRHLDDVVLVGHSYSGIPVGQAAERIGERLTHLVFVDANVLVDGESFTEGSADFEAAITENGGFWRPLPAADYEGQGLTDQQIARIVARSTPHPGATLTEPAALKGLHRRTPDDLYQVPPRLAGTDRDRCQVAQQRALATGHHGHRALADVLSASGTGADPSRHHAVVAT